MPEKLTDTIELPWPPSVNMVYRTFAYLAPTFKKGRGVITAANGKMYQARSRMIISEEGRIYFNEVVGLLLRSRHLKFGKARLKAVIRIHAKDKRRRDLGNLDKVLMDALQKGGIYHDDCQIDDQRFIRGQVCEHKNARVIIELTEITEEVRPPCDCPDCVAEFHISHPE